MARVAIIQYSDTGVIPHSARTSRKPFHLLALDSPSAFFCCHFLSNFSVSSSLWSSVSSGNKSSLSKGRFCPTVIKPVSHENVTSDANPAFSFGFVGNSSSCTFLHPDRITALVTLSCCCSTLQSTGEQTKKCFLPTQFSEVYRFSHS